MMLKTVFLGLMLAFLAGSGLANAVTIWSDNFENASTFEYWNNSIVNGWVIPNNSFSTNYSLSPTHSLWVTNDGAGRNLSIDENNKNDFWVRFSTFHTDEDIGVQDMAALTEDYYDSAECNGQYSIGMGIFNESGTWELNEWTNYGSMISTVPILTNTWQNMTVHIINGFAEDSNITWWIDGEYIGELIVTDASLFNVTAGSCHSVVPNDIIIDLSGTWASNTSFVDDVCVHNESLGYDCFYKAPEPPCVQNWTCTEWGECVRGYQTRICTDENECGNKTGEPAEIQLCLTPVPNATMNITQACCPISTLRCYDNSTLMELWNTSAGVAYAFEDCPFGCDNATSSCAPKAFEQNLYLLGIFIFIVVAGLIAIKWAKR